MTLLNAPPRPSPMSTMEQSSVIELALFAPTIEAAALVADFTNWRDEPMEKGQDGFFRFQTELPDGTYRHKFRVKSKSWFQPGQWVTITDPKATKVEPRTGNGILRVKDGTIIVDDYVWKHDDAQLPPNNKLAIYELHVADFTGGEADPSARGQFKHVIEKLPYLKDLGVNAIELMPIKEYPGDYSWGYNPLHLFAPEHHYGPSWDLKALIDAAHGQGMRIIFDGIYNHAHQDCPLAQIDHDYWFHHDPKDRAFSWGPQYNYELWDADLKVHPARQFIAENIAYWVSEYHIDGIRYDAAKQLESFDAMRLFSETARKAAGKKAFINIAEYLPEDPILVTGENHPMDAVWHDRFFWRLADGMLAGKAIDLSAIKDVIDPSRRGFTDCAQIVNYVSNHDHRRLMPRLAEYGIFDGSAFGRANLASTLLLTAVGMPMLWMGGEFGEYKSKTKTNGPSKIDWTLLKNQPNTDLRNHYRRMIQLRTTNEALQQNFIQFFFEDAARRILAYVRWTEHGKRVVVIANFGDAAHELHIPNMPCAGGWHDWIADKKVQVGADGLHTKLAGLEAKVLVWN